MRMMRSRLKLKLGVDRSARERNFAFPAQVAQGSPKFFLRRS